MKAIIIGNSGSGKTWLATQLAVHSGASVVHLDEIFWQPAGFNEKRSPAALEQLIADSKQHPSWIVEGVFGELAERYVDEADLLLWLDLNWPTCRERLLARGSESKQHMGREQSEHGLRALFEWASHYYDRNDLRSLAGHRELFKRFHGPRLCLHSQQAVSRWLANLRRQ
jgi:adenylate kinase family enzyme